MRSSARSTSSGAAAATRSRSAGSARSSRTQPLGGRVSTVYFVYRKVFCVNLLPRPRFVDIGDATHRQSDRVGTHRPGAACRGLRAPRSRRTARTSSPATTPVGSTLVRRSRSSHTFTNGSIPIGTIRDHPDLPVRAVMLDISRDKVPTYGDALRDLIDRLASVEGQPDPALQRAHLRLPRPRRGVTRRRARSRPSEIRELDAFCQRAPRGAGAEPELPRAHESVAGARASTGHLAIGADGFVDPRASATRADDDRARRTPHALALVRELLAELLPNFSTSRYVNVGLDETVGAAAGAARRATSSGSRRPARRCPSSTGARCSSGATSSPANRTASPQLPDGVTVCEWGYDAGYPFDERAATYEAGRDAVLDRARVRRAGSRILGRIDEHPRETVAGGRRRGARARRRPVSLNTDWGDQGHLQYLPISEPGSGVRRRGLVVSRRRTADIDLGAALTAHVLRRSDGRARGETLARDRRPAPRAVTPQIR